MPVRTGSVQDELLRLSGSTGNAFETVTASGNGSWVYFGPDRPVQFRLLIAGAVSGTSPTLDVKIQRAADAAGSGAEDVASFPQATTSQASASGALAEPPRVIASTTASKPYLRIVKTVGGSGSPTFNSVAVLHTPLGVAVA